MPEHSTPEFAKTVEVPVFYNASATTLPAHHSDCFNTHRCYTNCPIRASGP
jgi:hypothetical protein